MTKKEIAAILIKNNSLKNISQLHELYLSKDDIKKNIISGYSWDCVCCGKYDMRCDIDGYVDIGDEKIYHISDKDFWQPNK